MASVTIRFQRPLDGIHSIASAISLAIESGDEVFKDKGPPGAVYNVVIPCAVAHKIKGWCEQLHIHADNIAKGDHRKGVIER